MSTIYAILVVPEPGLDPYILPDGKADMAEAFQMMQHRVEEWIDEQTSVDVEEGNEPGSYTIHKINDTEIRIYAGDVGYTPGQHQALMTFTLTAISF